MSAGATATAHSETVGGGRALSDGRQSRQSGDLELHFQRDGRVNCHYDLPLMGSGLITQEVDLDGIAAVIAVDKTKFQPTDGHLDYPQDPFGGFTCNKLQKVGAKIAMVERSLPGAEQSVVLVERLQGTHLDGRQFGRSRSVLQKRRDAKILVPLTKTVVMRHC